MDEGWKSGRVEGKVRQNKMPRVTVQGQIARR